MDTATGSGSLEALMILSSGTVAGAGFGLLDIAVKNAVLVNQLDCGFLVEEPCVTVSLQKLPGAVCEERNLNGAF